MNNFFVLVVVACVAAGAFAQPAANKIDCNNPPQSDPDQCCKTPTFFKDDIILNCENQIKAKKNNLTTECIANCLLSGGKALNGNGSINKDTLTSLLIKQTGDSVWNKALTTAVNICTEEGAKRAADFENATKGNQCGPLPLFTIDCVYMQLFKNCPNDRWSSSE